MAAVKLARAMKEKEKRPRLIRRGPDAIVEAEAQRAGLLVVEEELLPVPVVLPLLLDGMPLEPVVELLRGTMPGGHLLALLDMLLEVELELELELLGVPLALEVPPGTQSFEESELLGLEVELLLGLVVVLLLCANAGNAMIRASAVVARICFTPILPG
jgi:hypothetical protein